MSAPTPTRLQLARRLWALTDLLGAIRAGLVRGDDRWALVGRIDKRMAAIKEAKR